MSRRAMLAVVVPITLSSCFGQSTSAASVRCPNAGARCVAHPGATITFLVPPQRCGPSERVCYYLASIPDEQMQQPAPTEHDRVSLQRTTILGNHDSERVTIATSRDDRPGQRYFVEVRYAPMSTVSSAVPFRVVLAYELATHESTTADR